LYVRTFPAVSGYVLRRVADELSALVVVAAVFTVAGERRAEDPQRKWAPMAPPAFRDEAT
jgi:hypothetical protein